VTCGLTPCFSPGPSIPDLYDSERIVGGIRGGQYLVRKRQEIIIVIDDLGGHHIILCGGVAENSLGSDAKFHTLIAIL